MSLLKEDAVAKKNSKPSEPGPLSRKPMVVQIRGSEEWKTWVEEIAEKDGYSLAMLFERALRKYAKDAGFRDPPRR